MVLLDVERLVLYKVIISFNILGLASELNYKLCILDLNAIESDEHLSARIGDAPERSLLLMEDVDAYFVGRTS